MDIQQPPPATPSFDLSSIYYTLFRHKWKIVICSLLGLGLAAGYSFYFPPPYASEAKLFIRFVISEGNKPPGPGQSEQVTKSPDQRGETIISSELEVLTSWDLAAQVAKNVGPEKILAKINGGKNPVAAAGAIRQGLLVEVPPHSSVIQITFQHRDSEVVQAVLKELIDTYLKKHVEIHRAVGIVGDFLAQETDQLRARLAQTEEELRKVTNKAGIISLEEYKKTSGIQMARIQEQIFDLQAELAARTSIYKELTKNAPPASTSAETNAPPPLSAMQIGAYQKAVDRVTQLRQQEQQLLVQFTPESAPVLGLRQQLADAEKQVETLEAETPALVQLRRPAATATGTPSRNPAEEFNPALEAAKINALEVRMKTLISQQDAIRAEAAKVDQLEVSILDFRRRKELEEANYRYYAQSLEQSRINEALGTGRVSNISVIETPTPPYPNTKKTNKILAGLAGSGIALGLIWAFAIELYLDRSVRRSADVERILRLPLFLSIPKIALNGKKKKRLLKSKDPAPPEGDATALVPLVTDGHESRLTPFYQTLRDRLISFFETINLLHKPKLVAVTGLGTNSGVTTIAAGLARSFSEIGEGNVLLVDMTQGQGSAQHFQKGNAVDIDQLFDTRNSAFVRNNLYVVSETSSSERLAKGMPQRFNMLIPKLKASDFDFIIFDMPPVNQISITPRLASFMDMILLVVESEKTDRDLAQNASDLLAKSKTPLGVVLNKAKSYIPTKLHQEHDFLVG
ncbi:MAG TPA: Wzz/FepE/Etk N-terminal domain-containing protein [Lacunisphaera sp.]|nr:Wzz/FepE/Etk N-terminal domain-containing protein [Lacunisphaera sp.]